MLDIVAIDERGLPVAALVWAAPAKDPGFTPWLMLEEMTCNSRPASEKLGELRLQGEIDIVGVKRRFLDIVRATRDMIDGLDWASIGYLYVDTEGSVAMPDDTALREGRLRLHPAVLRGSWPQPI